MSKTSNKSFNFLIPIVVIVAFVIGLFAPKIFANSEEEIIISMTESMTTSFFAVTVDEDFAEIDIDFNHVKAKVTDKETEHDPGLYEVTGEFTHDGVTYTFTHEIAFHDGIYMHLKYPDFEEK